MGICGLGFERGFRFLDCDDIVGIVCAILCSQKQNMLHKLCILMH